MIDIGAMREPFASVVAVALILAERIHCWLDRFNRGSCRPADLSVSHWCSQNRGKVSSYPDSITP